ncbi:MAG: sigma-70 family RNA polymerase sigma factor [Polyangiaceae bacterium]|nr:sigma-70 family RNA polymerase sigma factor [Polyangiaceae bacterium]
MSHRPPTEPPDDPPKPSNSRRFALAFGLTKTEFDELIKAMLGIVGKVGCPAHIDRMDVVHDAFVTALEKPISERVSSAERERFIGWMCELARYAALTTRNADERLRLCREVSDEEIAQLLSTPARVPDVGVRKALQEALASLDAEDQALLLARFVEDKDITEFARARKLAPSTAYSRFYRVLGLLRAALKAIIVATVLLVVKNARAQGARLARHVSRLLPHAGQTACAMTVTVACGIVVPASSTAMTVRQDAPSAVSLALPETPSMDVTAPPMPVEVAPVEQIGLDEPDEQWSAAVMKSNSVAICIQGSLVPFAFLIASAMTQLGCAGAEQHTAPPQEPAERDGSGDPWVQMCENQRMRGESCLSKADWCARMGLRPAPKGCQ